MSNILHKELQLPRMKDRNASTNIEPSAGKTGFTLIELLVVLAVFGLLFVLLLLPTYADSRTKSRSLRCLDNMNRVITATMMYTHDNHDLFPPNPSDGSSSSLGYCWAVGNVAGGMPNQSPPAGSATFNSDMSSNSNAFLLLRYAGGDSTVFRCTADPRKGYYSGTDFNKFGTIVPAIRSISMSVAVGTIDQSALNGGPHSGIPNQPVGGDWLTGVYHANRHNNPWRTYGSLVDMNIPIPANTCVMIEEDPYSINDGLFAFSAGMAKWIDFPSTRHNMACVISFGDSHVELHKWQNPAMRLTSGAGSIPPITPNDPDWVWLQARTSVRAQ